MAILNHSKFERGSGCYNCESCERQTRNTGDNGALKLCPECYEIAGLENELSDYGYQDGSIQRRIDTLTATAIEKGGKL